MLLQLIALFDKFDDNEDEDGDFKDNSNNNGDITVRDTHCLNRYIQLHRATNLNFAERSESLDLSTLLVLTLLAVLRVNL